MQQDVKQCQNARVKEMIVISVPIITHNKEAGTNCLMTLPDSTSKVAHPPQCNNYPHPFIIQVYNAEVRVA